MNGSYDLLPSSCRELVLRRTRVRRWIMAYAMVLGVLCAGYVLLNFGRDAQVTRRNTLEAQVRQNWERNEEAQGLFREIQELGSSIARYNRLAWPIRVSDTIAILESIMPKSATLTGLTLTPRIERTRGAMGKDGKRAPDEVFTFLAVEMEGVALDDLAVARVVSGLDEHAIFNGVTLDYARSRAIDQTPAREFRINFEIDLNKRYAFVDASGGEEMP